MPEAVLPVPPRELAARVGTAHGADPVEFYVEEGARLRKVIEELLPRGWDWADKRVLDFGCGSARVLRHFATEARDGTFFGCDIDRASIDWDTANLTPPFTFLHSGMAPPLELPTGSLDLIWAMSVFTHIADQWNDWLAEMHRLLDDGGILVASFLGQGMWEALVHEPYLEDEVGMAVLHHWEGPDAWVFHSEWWLREHWGRAFEVLAVRRPPRGPDGSTVVTHSYIALRRREVTLDLSELERVNASEPREVAGLRTSVRLARGELASLATNRPQTTAGHVSTLRRAARTLRRAARTFRRAAQRLRRAL